MNTPAPVDPTPQTAPTAAGILQGLATGWLTMKGAQKLGIPPDASIVLAGAAVSTVTSLFHQLAQKWHLSL